MSTETDKEGAPYVPVTGRFNRFTSPYWAAMLAAFGSRYPVRLGFKEWSDKQKTFSAGKHAYSGVVGVLMEGVTGFFALRTWKDMKSIFAESVAWETGKEPGNVGFFDFWNSQNSMV